MSKDAEGGKNIEVVSDQEAIAVAKWLIGGLAVVKEGKMGIDEAKSEVSRYPAGGVIAVACAVFDTSIITNLEWCDAMDDLRKMGHLVNDVGLRGMEIVLSEETMRQAVEGTAMIRQAVEVVRGWQERHRGSAVDVDGANARAMLDGWGAGGAQEQESGSDGVVQGALDGTREEVLDKGGVRS